MTFKDFAKASIRAAVAIFLALLAIVLVIAGSLWAKGAYEKHQAQQYEAIKEWNVDLREALSLQFRVRTKLVDGRLLASIQVDGYPAYLAARRNKDAEFRFEFLDKDGFKVFDKPVKVAEFTSVVDKTGDSTGLEHQFDEYLAIDTYKRFSRPQVGWTVDVKAVSAAPAVAAASPAPVLDHCTPGLSKAERLRRLAQHGALREAGNGEYTAGPKSVHFFADGTLLDCR